MPPAPKPSSPEFAEQLGGFLRDELAAPSLQVTGVRRLSGGASRETFEISMDGGETWEQAEIKPALSPFSWVLWHKEWTPTQKGNHGLVVRATDGVGHLQSAEEAPPIPDGASGFHHRNVKSG